MSYFLQENDTKSDMEANKSRFYWPLPFFALSGMEKLRGGDYGEGRPFQFLTGKAGNPPTPLLDLVLVQTTIGIGSPDEYKFRRIIKKVISTFCTCANGF
jgi:hypothetical protein